jgi:hypothetical protein
LLGAFLFTLVLVLQLRVKNSMKVICVILVMMVSQCAGQSPGTIASIEFVKQSRGFHDKIVISPDSVHGVVENHRATQKSEKYALGVDHAQWSNVLASLKDISLKDLDGLQSPTMDRAHDGAIHSSIVINFEDGTSVSHGFDDEKPHPDLQPLLNAILAFKQGKGKR